jgi:hypothetical protein
MLDVEDPYLGYDAEKFPWKSWNPNVECKLTAPCRLPLRGSYDQFGHFWPDCRDPRHRSAIAWVVVRTVPCGN